MSDANRNDPRPWTAPQPVGRRSPDPQRNPQWATDDSAYASCLVYAAIGTSVLGAIVGGVLWFFWEAIELFFG